MKLKQSLFPTLLFLQLFNTSTLKADSLTIIHTDPTDIRKTSIIGGAHTSLPYSSGMYFGLNQYLKPRTMLYFNWFLFTEYSKSSVIVSTYDSDKSPNIFDIRNFGIERHLAEVEEANFNRINITSRHGFGSNDRYVTVPGNIRKVLALTAGIMVLNGRQLYFRDGDFKTENNYLTKVSTGKKVDVSDESLPTYAKDIYTRTSVTCLEVGLKHKRLRAVGVYRNGYGRRWSDNLFEYYLSFLIPVAGRGDEKVYLNGKTNEAYKISNLKTATPGFKLGFNIRTSITSDLSMGAEAGFLPSVIGGSTLYMSARLGVCINAGKLKLTKEKMAYKR